MFSRLLVDLARQCYYCGFLIPVGWPAYLAPNGHLICGRCRNTSALTVLGGSRRQRRAESRRLARR